MLVLVMERAAVWLCVGNLQQEISSVHCFHHHFNNIESLSQTLSKRSLCVPSRCDVTLAARSQASQVTCRVHSRQQQIMHKAYNVKHQPPATQEDHLRHAAPPPALPAAPAAKGSALLRARPLLLHGCQHQMEAPHLWRALRSGRLRGDHLAAAATMAALLVRTSFRLSLELRCPVDPLLHQLCHPRQ